MEISKKQLISLDRDTLQRYSHADLVDLSEELLNRVRHLEERLNKNSSNSSIAPSTFIPGRAANESDLQNNKSNEKEKPVIRKRKQREKGVGRTERLPVTATRAYYPEQCENCSHVFSDYKKNKSVCFTAYYQLDLERSTDSLGGYIATHVKNTLFSTHCDLCHQSTCYSPKKAVTSGTHIHAREWQLIGPTLSSVIAYLKYDIGSTIRKIQRLLFDMFRIRLSVGAICKNLHETGLAAEPITE